MNQPANQAVVPFYVVVAPGKNPDLVLVEPSVQKLTWNFGQMDRGDLIDLVEEVDEFCSAYVKWVKAAREVLKQTLEAPTAENPQVIVAGHRYQANYTYSIRRDINREMVRKEMGDKWYADHCSESPVLTLKITPIVQTPGVAG